MKGRLNYTNFILSTAFLLGMLDEGAEGETQAEIARTLGLGNASREEVNELMAALLGYTGTADGQVSVAYANNVTLNTKYNYQLSETFSNAMKTYYDASVVSADFSKPEALKTVNEWSREHSKGLIPSIIDELDESVVMCLLNAVYFKGAWTHPFDKSNTSASPFKKGDGLWTEIKMMNDKTTASYYEESGFQALNLPVGDGTYSMTLLLPAKGKTVAAMLSDMSANALQQLNFEEHEVDIVDEEYGDIQVLENLIALDDEILWEFATNTVAQYSSTFIKCEKREFPYVLQITWMQDKPLKMLYDPYYQKDRLYTYSTEVRDNTWIVAEDLSKIKPYALKKLRGLFEEAMHQLRVEHEKPIDEN